MSGFIDFVQSNALDNLMDTLMVLAIFGPFALFLNEELKIWREIEDEENE